MSLIPTSGTDNGGTFVFGLTVINQLSVGGTLKFVIFSLGATNATQYQASNTVTATFKARPGSQGVTVQSEPAHQHCFAVVGTEGHDCLDVSRREIVATV